MHSNSIKEQFLLAQSRYYGSPTPENSVFNTNLQMFAQKVSIISALHTGNKLSSPEAFAQVEQLWQQLDHSQKKLLQT